MQFSTLALFAAAAVASPLAQAPLSGPFKLTVVPKDGSDSYPLVFAPNGLKDEIVLATGKAATTTFGIDSVEHRLFDVNKGSVNETSALDKGARIVLTPEDGQWGFDQVTQGGAVYLVKAGTADAGINSFRSTSDEGYPLYWLGADDADANAAVRIDKN